MANADCSTPVSSGGSGGPLLEKSNSTNQFEASPRTKLVHSRARAAATRGEYVLIGVAGGTASGKTTVCNRIINELGDQNQGIILISQDNFYKSLTPQQHSEVENYNFDHPDAFDHDLFYSCLLSLFRGEAVDIPTYDFVTHSRTSKVNKLMPTSKIIIAEGVLVLFDERVRNLMSLMIFVDTDDDLRLIRRIRRDVSERGRDYEGVLRQYERFVKPSFDEFVAKTKQHAHILIPRWPNEVAVDLICQHIRGKLGVPDIRRSFPNLKILPSNSQVRQLHTIVRDARCKRTDFIFYTDRLIRLLVEFGLGFVPFKDKIVRTPTGHAYSGTEGVEFFDNVCAVSVLRAGEVMESGLLSVCWTIPIGKILLRFPGGAEDEGTTSARPFVIFHKLPKNVAKRTVLVLDPVLGSGSGVAMAVDLLVEQGVEERNIIILTLIATTESITLLCSRHPELRVVTSEVDRYVNEREVVPGIGSLADRYFGTEDSRAQFSSACPFLSGSGSEGE